MSGQARILPDLAEKMKADYEELVRLRAENAKLREDKATAKVLGYKVTEKGGVSVYGLGRFPVTLYGSQWDKLLANVAEIKAYIDANRSKLAFKE